MVTQLTPAYLNGGYYRMRMSQDGKYIITATYGGVANYISSDYGQTWVRPNSSYQGYDADISQTGQYIFFPASTNADQYYRSDDYGQTFTRIYIATMYWNTCSCSADGRYVLLGGGVGSRTNPGRLYLSSDYGVTWGEVQPGGNVDILWRSAAISENGQYMYVNGYRSQDYGATWTTMAGTGNCMACSYDGSIVFVDASLSTNYGVNFANKGNGLTYGGVSMSADGSRILRGYEGGRVWFSRNTGATWEEVRPLGDATSKWRAVAVSADGRRMAVGSNRDSHGLYLVNDWNSGMLLNFMD